MLAGAAHGRGLRASESGLGVFDHEALLGREKVLCIKSQRWAGLDVAVEYQRTADFVHMWLCLIAHHYLLRLLTQRYTCTTLRDNRSCCGHSMINCWNSSMSLRELY